MPCQNISYVRLGIVALACFITGCATLAPPATSEMDARGKSFAVAQGNANIYVYRNENIGGAVTIEGFGKRQRGRSYWTRHTFSMGS